MRRFAGFLVVVMLGLTSVGRSQGLDDEYVQIFRTIQEADGLRGSAPAQALAKYMEAQTALDRLHKGSPDWNSRIVNYRLGYVADQIAALSKDHGQPAAEATSTNSAAAQAPGATANPAAEWQARAAALEQQLAGLQSDNALLQAKLKEALAVRPAAVDPAEMAKLQERLKALERENELLKASREKASTEAVDAKSLEEARRSAAEASRKASEQAALVAQLTLQKEALEAKLKQLAQQPATSPVPAATAATTAQVKELETERNDLQRRLEIATKELAARKSKRKGGASVSQDLESELVAARARLEILEAKATPYSDEEQALLKRPDAVLGETSGKQSRKSLKDLPAGAAAQIAEAQRYFAAKDFEKAEAAYVQVLKQDPKNVVLLANLAAIQVEAQHFDQAEANIQQALALDSEDPYSLYVLGILRFREKKYDDALGALSRAAKLDPQNAEVQNYLGLALSEKGLRVPAEAALRKAIQLQPGYAGAHYNLAVVYATQQPPALELARFHYQKALAAGYPPNADLQKRFEARQ